MNDIEYAIAYSEVLEILKYISIDDYNKIPKSKIQLFKNNSDKKYDLNYNPNISLGEQNISKRAKAIIAILFRDYWATQEQREKIIAKQKYDRYQIEKNSRLKYNPDDLFLNKSNMSSNIKGQSMILTEYKESLLNRILKKIKKIFYR